MSNYALNLDNETVSPYGVTFAEVVAVKRDRMAEFVAGILSADDMATIVSATAERVAEDFEADLSEYKMRANSRKIAAANGRDKVTDADVLAAREFISENEFLSFHAVDILRNSRKASASLNLASVYEGDMSWDVVVTVKPREYGKPARVIDPNSNNL